MFKKMLIAGFCIMMFLGFAGFVFAEEDKPPKVVVLGEVKLSGSAVTQNEEDVKETIQMNIRNELEKRGKGKYIVNLAVPEQSAPSGIETEIPNSNSQALANHLAAIQKLQQQQQHPVRQGHVPVNADAYFDFRVSNSANETDTSGVADTVGNFIGYDTSLGSFSTRKFTVFLTVSMRDPKTGMLLDQHTAKSSSTKVRNVAGYSSYNYGNDSADIERLFSKTIKECVKWIDDKKKQF